LRFNVGKHLKLNIDKQPTLRTGKRQHSAAAKDKVQQRKFTLSSSKG
jgi:hypothetical protein